MSLHIHVATKYQVTWDGDWFNYRPEEFEAFLETIPDLNYYLGSYDPESGIYDRISIDAEPENIKRLEDEIARLRETPEDPHPSFPPLYRDEPDSVYTCGEVADNLEEIINRRDKNHKRIELMWA